MSTGRRFVSGSRGGLGFGGRIWDLIVTVPDHCLSFFTLLPSYLFVHIFIGRTVENAQESVLIQQLT